MLYPAAWQTSLLTPNWQIRPLLPSDSLEQLSDQIHRAHALHVLRPVVRRSSPDRRSYCRTARLGKGLPLQQALQGHRRSTNYLPNVTARPLVTSHAFPSTRLIR